MMEDTHASLLEQLGFMNVPPEKKEELEGRALEILQMRIGLRLSEDLSDEQLDQLEHMIPASTDSTEVMAQKQQSINEWLKQNHPNYDQVVSEEIAKFKQDLSGVSAADLDTAL